MFGLAERAAGIHGDVSVEALTDGSDGGECGADLQRQTRKDQLPSASRFDSARDARVIEGVDRGTIDDWG